MMLMTIVLEWQSTQQNSICKILFPSLLDLKALLCGDIRARIQWCIKSDDAIVEVLIGSNFTLMLSWFLNETQLSLSLLPTHWTQKHTPKKMINRIVVREKTYYLILKKNCGLQRDENEKLATCELIMNLVDVSLFLSEYTKKRGQMSENAMTCSVCVNG